MDWLQIAADAFKGSTSYMDANYRKQWEESLSMFQSRHAPGSKYNSEAYKSRSRLFRPKTRSIVRKNEAASVAAFFSSVDVVSVQAENKTDPMAMASADVMYELLNYRLQKTIPWFHLVVGASQDAQIYGMVCSYQYWNYQEVETPSMNALGAPQYKVVCDEPCIELIPPENYRFDPGADWINPVKTSPYFIRLVPMYVADVKARMKALDRKTGQPKWLPLSDGEIRTAKTDYDTTRMQREKPHTDPLDDNEAPLSDFEIVWCHENFVKREGQDWVYWTMGTQHMLSDPVPIENVYFTGERPFVTGTFALEAHRAMPESYVHIGMNLQREANDVVNQRMDNVKMVLNKRWLVKRGAQVDVQSLNRNVAGGVTMVNDPQQDVQEINWPDVTSSAYQEQDRINADLDELMGNFSVGSVQTNRALNDTVGGMNLAAGATSQLTEYGLRTFVETWAEPVLRQLAKLEAAYETDMTLLALAGKAAKVFEKYGINQVTDQMLNQDLSIRVDVGPGATNPNVQLQKVSMATDIVAKMAAAFPDAKQNEIRKFVFSLAGERNASRFFPEEGGQESQMNKMLTDHLNQTTQALEQAQSDQQEKLAQKANEAKKLDLEEQKLVIDKFNADTNRMKVKNEKQATVAEPQAQTIALAEVAQSMAAIPQAIQSIEATTQAVLAATLSLQEVALKMGQKPAYDFMYDEGGDIVGAVPVGVQ